MKINFKIRIAARTADVPEVHAMALQAHAELYATGKEPTGQGNAHGTVAPYQMFKTSNGNIFVGSWAEDTWPRLCAAIDHLELVDDPRFATNVLRLQNLKDLVAIFGAEIEKRTTEEWEKKFHKAKGLFGPVLTISESLAHPQMATRPGVVEVAHPVKGTVSVPNPASAVWLHETPGAVTSPPPLFSEHARQILTEIGLSTDEIDALGSEGVVALDSTASRGTPS